jgi:hypothetical protein
MKQQPEPNFARLVTEQDLAYVEITAHALQRFVDRLQPGIPGAERAAEIMGRLEQLPSGTRTSREQNQLREHRDWLRRHVEPCIRDLLACEGFWTSERPRWSQSRTPSDGYLQVGGMCGFPAALHGHTIVLTTCTNGRDITWDTALHRGYTLMPKPVIQIPPIPLRKPPLTQLILHAWQSRNQHHGLLAALRHQRAQALQTTTHQNTQRQTAHQTARENWEEQRERAIQTFRMRHQ